jgi:hypothetical protein
VNFDALATVARSGILSKRLDRCYLGRREAEKVKRGGKQFWHVRQLPPSGSLENVLEHYVGAAIMNIGHGTRVRYVSGVLQVSLTLAILLVKYCSSASSVMLLIILLVYHTMNKNGWWFVGCGWLKILLPQGEGLLQ